MIGIPLSDKSGAASSIAFTPHGNVDFPVCTVRFLQSSITGSNGTHLMQRHSIGKAGVHCVLF